MNIALPGLEADPFDAPVRDPDALTAETFEVALEGFEGPLDLLLAMARRQKVDLRRISVLTLAEQYLGFIAEARRLRIELAADYLVMAAWLALLKSRLLLPPAEGEDAAAGEALAGDLALRLARLEAMRERAAALMARDRLGRDFFARGMTERLSLRRVTIWDASLADLLKAYAQIRTRDEFRPFQIDRAAIFAVEDALERLRRLTGETLEWADLARYLPEGRDEDAPTRRSALASSFAAALELAKQGEVELRQETSFAPLYLRRRDRAPA